MVLLTMMGSPMFSPLSTAAFAGDGAIELQIAASSLLDGFTIQAWQAGKDCPTVVDAGGAIGTAIVNHVSWPRDVETHPYLVPGVEAVTVPLSVGDLETVAPIARIPLDLHFRTLDCVYDPFCSLFDTHLVRIWLDYTLSLGPDGLCADYVGPTDPLPQGTADAVADQVERFGRPCIDLTEDLDPLLALVDQDAVLDVAMIPDPSFDAVIVRASVDDPDTETLVDWQAFLGGELLAPWDGDSRIVIDDGLLQRGFASHLTRAVTCSWMSAASCDDEVEPNGTVSTGWHDDPPSVVAEVGVYGTSCSGWLGNVLIATTTFDMETHPPFGVSSFYANEATYTLHTVTALDTALPALGCGGAWDAVEDRMDAVFAGMGGSCERVGDEVDCEAPFPLLSSDFGPGSDLWAAPWTDFATNVDGGLALDVIWGWGAGPAVPDPLDLDGTRAVYDIRPDRCSVHAGYEGLLEMDGGPGQLCDADDLGLPTPLVLDDPEGVYDLGYGSVVADRVYTVHPTAAFWADPYPALVTVWSTAGAATVQLGAPVDANLPEGIDFKLIKAIVDAWIACHPAYNGPPIPGWFDLHWLVDPPPYELVVKGDDWLGATAVLDKAQVLRSEPRLDKELGLTVVDGAVLTTSWTVSHPRMGAFGFTVDTVIPVTLAGTDDALTPASPTSVAIAVPAASLPRGASSMTFDLALAPGDQVFTPIAR